MKIFIKETDYANTSLTHIFLFIIILKKNSFWREFWVERVTALWLKEIGGAFLTEGAFVQKKLTAKSSYLFLQKASS